MSGNELAREGMDGEPEMEVPADCLRRVHEESRRALLHTIRAMEWLVEGIQECRGVVPDVPLSRGLKLMKQLQHAGELLHAVAKIADLGSFAPWGHPKEAR